MEGCVLEKELARKKEIKGICADRDFRSDITFNLEHNLLSQHYQGRRVDFWCGVRAERVHIAVSWPWSLFWGASNFRRSSEVFFAALSGCFIKFNEYVI